ncbi:MAG: hypothetical protein A4E23_01558 [Methanomethylovorans sp. PtaU1.Bin073]|nr:MAG: hypothetical protein A4E23_01558 [Methanomethylovorans sp. PtaU1.Bin073]
MSSSIFEVEIGSSALQGSSNNITSGLTASVLAMHSLCCCPPLRFRADVFSLSATSSHSAPERRASSTILSISFLETPCIFGPYAILSCIDMGKGFGFWNTIPTLFRSSTTSTSLEYMSLSSIFMFPSILQFFTKSFILFMHLKNVDFPHPEGPIRAVTLFLGISIEIL